MATAMTAFNSVEGLLGHLDDEDDEVIETSLQSLLDLIPYHWAEIADELTKIERLSEDDDFPFSKLASLLASKIFFHIQSYEDSLNHALCAGDLFNVVEESDYVKKLTEQCIDSYRTYQQTQYKNKYESKEAGRSGDDDSDSDSDSDSDDSSGDQNMDNNDIKIDNNLEAIDPRKVKIVEQVFEFCYKTQDFKHAIGIAIECRRIDRVKQAIQLSDNKTEMLEHCFKLCETVISSRTFRDEILGLIVTSFDATNTNYNTICRCYFYLDDTKPISDILWTLINCPNIKDENNRKELTSYQIAFDLTGYQNDAFLRGIFNNIPKPPYTQLYPDRAKDKKQKEQQKPIEPNDNDNSDAVDIGATSLNDNENNDNNDAMVVDEQPADEPEEDISNYWEDELLKKWKQLKSILLGECIIPKYLDFLYRNCHSDVLILKKIKDGISERNSVLNNSLICSNGIMHCGTTIDQFLRDNLDWMGRAAHWSKFTATASVGMIHNKHLSDSMNILSRYLPGSGGGPYQEGGALYALGLIHVGDNSDITCGEIRDYLLNHLKSASNEILQHGSCLGLGLACFGYGTQSGGGANKVLEAEKDIDSDDEDDDNDNDNDDPIPQPQPEPEMDGIGPSASDILTEIRNVLFQDRAVPGEAAGLALGLILCGSGNKQWYEEMIAYSHETQHEKIQRGLVMGISIIFYNLQEQAEYAITRLINDKSETIRYGGCYCIGLAYAATGNTSAISQLLHLAVSDASNDVRRAAVTNIGFVLCNKPNSVPKVVQLLSNSYNEHVRYGSAAALGIACSGTGNLQALSILKQLCKDKVDYVRQAALISIGMLLQEHNETECKQVTEIREKYLQSIAVDKREPTMCQMGAILGCGIIDCSGRNSTISLFNKYQNCKKQYSIIGMAIFWQYWYWYPLIPFITLCLQPTMIMCLNNDLKMIKINCISKEKNKKLFKYVEKIKIDKEKKKKKQIKVSLSTAKKSKQREDKKQKDKKDDDDNDNDIEMKQELKKDLKEEKKEEKKEELIEGLLTNPSRVTPNQIKYVQWIDKRYKPLTNRLYGFVMVEDTKPQEKTVFVEQQQIKSGGVYGDEPKPPKPFLYLGN